MKRIGVRTRVAKQQGVAVIWMVLLLVPIMGFGFWAVEGTRYIQEKSRLEDAAEAAALAVTMEDRSESSKKMAEAYMRAYVRDIDTVKLDVIRTFQEANPDKNIPEVIQYSVDAQTVHQSWFSSDVIPSFSKKQAIAGYSLAKKSPEFLGNKNIDIVFVSDFSNSMNSGWDGDEDKIDVLKNAILSISNKILVKDAFDGKVKNRVAFVPYNLRVQDKISNELICNSQLRYNDKFQKRSELSYEEVNWGYWSTRDEEELEDCKKKQSKCPAKNENERKKQHQEAKRIYHVFSLDGDGCRDGYTECYKYIDYNNTVLSLFKNKIDSFDFHYKTSGNNLYSSVMCSSKSNGFYSIPLSKDILEINQIEKMSANGNTGAYQGIIRGAQILADGRQLSNSTQADIDAYKSRLKMLLILSDGQEYPNKGILSTLVNNNMCDKIREEFSDSEVPLYIGVIGIKFEASGQDGFKNCVLDPKEDIIDVDNVNDLIDKIEELIQKGSESDGIPKLYG
ncbi:pilus assembly protein TadG-related protein [Photobacterium nomapromontoriensis]|uniref:pilus assembly protein TadG-related protein n=1 Tax=Photobacterium nomapromontoriensis TaxID=2910237 RepID=UPI003D10ED2A